MGRGYVYIITNHSNNVLYTGVTNNLKQRIYEHKTGKGSMFASKYKCQKLVYFDETDDICAAIKYEKKIKSGSRKKKIQLIREQNPQWVDLAQGWFDA
ncbi:GIY-YIG nuclease family protein [Candidatus Gracilibacteria bacterium]|nr:GIY-YIG nuclease family protein [Candidatus Gracilibacteria bacterium]MCF7819472.1 GIY-YIG nuclease family protein [Candidatus Gracilibacteria bacterium]